MSRYASVVLLATIASGLATFLALALVPSRYAAEATLAVADYPGAAVKQDSLGDHIRGLKDPELLLSVVRDLNIQGAAREVLIGEFPERLQVTQLSARTLKVRFEFEDANVAAAVANRLIVAFTERLQQSAGDQTLSPRIEALRSAVEEAEAAVERERARFQQAKDENEDASSIEGRLADARTDLAKALELHARAVANLDEARSITPANAINNSGVVAFPALQALVKEQNLLARQLGEVTSGKRSETQAKQLRTELEALRKSIAAEVASTIRHWEDEARAASNLAEASRERVVALERQAIAAREQELSFANATEAAKEKHAAFELLQQQLQMENKEASRRAGSIRLVTEARVPSTPASRRAPPALSMMALTLLLGFGLAVGREVVAQDAVESARTETERLARAEGVTGAADQAERLGRERFAEVNSVGAAADLLLMRSCGRAGFRTFVANERPSAGVGDEALELARALGCDGRQVVLLNWDLEGTDLARSHGSSRSLGMNDLLVGGASFEDIIKANGANAIHVIEAGSAVKDKSAALHPDRLNVVLDALDEVYDHIVIAAKHEDARALFAAMEGRFDACLSVADVERRAGSTPAGANQFLGFELAGMDVIRLGPAARHLRGSGRPRARQTSTA